MIRELKFKSSRRALIVSTAFLSLFCCCWAFSQVITPPSGFITLTIRGTGGTGSGALTFVGLGLTRPVEYQGNFEAFAANAFTDNQSNWNDDQFNGANGKYYLEITLGPYAGLMTDITDTIGTTKSITTVDDFSMLIPPITSGTTYKIRKHWTLASLFGPNNEAGLGGASSVSFADEILVYDPTINSGNGGYITYYYRTLGSIGWRISTSTTVDQSNAKIDLTQGILIKRKQASDLGVKLYGSVKMGYTATDIKTGLNVVGNVYPTDTLTLGNSGLYTGDPTTGLAGGATLSSADEVQIFNGTGLDSYYWRVLGSPPGWRSAINSGVDASGTVIPAGSSIVIKRKAGRPEFFWYVAQPF